MSQHNPRKTHSVVLLSHYGVFISLWPFENLLSSLVSLQSFCVFVVVCLFVYPMAVLCVCIVFCIRLENRLWPTHPENLLQLHTHTDPSPDQTHTSWCVPLPLITHWCSLLGRVFTSLISHSAFTPSCCSVSVLPSVPHTPSLTLRLSSPPQLPSYKKCWHVSLRF